MDSTIVSHAWQMAMVDGEGDDDASDTFDCFLPSVINNNFRISNIGFGIFFLCIRYDNM